ncbi:MAG: NTP transferase domain-containing protein [Aminipila sp.]
MKSKINLIILAAGNSRRFGNNKLLADICGTPLYRCVLGSVEEARERLVKEDIDCNIITVTQYNKIAKEASKLGHYVAINQRPELGISYSIRLGIETCLKSGTNNKRKILKPVNLKNSARKYKANIMAKRINKKEGDMFIVADQPFLTGQSIYKLAKEFLINHKPMGGISYNGKIGNPCIFHISYRQKLLALKGDEGGKKILIKKPENYFMVECSGEKELSDIDYVEDLDEILRE